MKMMLGGDFGSAFSTHPEYANAIKISEITTILFIWFRFTGYLSV